MTKNFDELGEFGVVDHQEFRSGRSKRMWYIWTLVWVTIWAARVMDEWAKVGRYNVDSFGGSSPARALLSWDGVDKKFAASCVSLGISVLVIVYTL